MQLEFIRKAALVEILMFMTRVSDAMPSFACVAR